MFDKALEYLSEGRVAFSIVAVIFGVIFNAKKVIEFVDVFRKRRIELLQEASKSEAVSPLLKEHFQKEIEDEYFRLAYKRRMNEKLRILVLEISNNKDIPFFHFLRSASYLKNNNGCLSVEIPLFDKIGYYFNNVLGFSSIVFGILISILIGEMAGHSILNAIILLGMSVFLLFMGVIMVFQSFSVYSGRLIERKLAE